MSHWKIYKNRALSLILILPCIIFPTEILCTFLDLSYFKPCPINLKAFTKPMPDLIHTLLVANQYGSDQSLQIHNNSSGKSFDLDNFSVRPSKATTYCDLFVLINPPNYTVIEPKFQFVPTSGNSPFNTFIILQVHEEQTPGNGRLFAEEGLCVLPDCFLDFEVWNSLIIFISMDPHWAPETPSGRYYIYCSHCDGSYLIVPVLLDGFTLTGYTQIRGIWDQLNVNLEKAVIPILSTNRAVGLNYMGSCTYTRRNWARAITDRCYPNFYLAELLAEYYNFTPGYELKQKAFQYPFRLDFGFMSHLTRGKTLFQEDSKSMVPLYCQPSKGMSIIAKSPSALLVDFLKSLTWSTIFFGYGTWGAIVYGSITGRGSLIPLTTILNGIIGGLCMLLRQETGGAGTLLSKMTHLQILHVIMSLVAIILSTGYEGRVTSTVITPSPPYVIRDLSELLDNGFRLYIPAGNQTTDASVERILSRLYETFFKRYGCLHRMMDSFFIEKVASNHPHDRASMSIGMRKVMFAGNMSTQARTGRVAILINEDAYFIASFIRHKYPDVRCHLIKDIVMDWSSYWNIYNRYSGQFATFMTRIQTHGFSALATNLLSWINTHTSSGYDEVHRPMKLSIKNTKEVFELYYYCLGISSLVFVLESLGYRSQVLINLIYKCFALPKIMTARVLKYLKEKFMNRDKITYFN